MIIIIFTPGCSRGVRRGLWEHVQDAHSGGPHHERVRREVTPLQVHTQGDLFWIFICLHLSIYQYISNIYLSTPKVIHSVLEDKEVTIHADSSRTKPGSRRWKYCIKNYLNLKIFNVMNMPCQVHPRQGRGGRSAIHPFAAPRLQAWGRLRWGKVPQIQPGNLYIHLPSIYLTI